MRNIENGNTSVRFGMKVLSSLAFLACLGLTPEAIDLTKQSLIQEALNAYAPEELKNLDYFGRDKGTPDANMVLDSTSRAGNIQKLEKLIGITKSRLCDIQDRINKKNEKLKASAAELVENSNKINANQDALASEKRKTPSDAADLNKLTEEANDLSQTKYQLTEEIKLQAKGLCEDFKLYHAKKRVLSDQETSLAGLRMIGAIMDGTSISCDQ